MALNFPDTPTVGQLFPSPATAGVPQWKWDGTEWVMVLSDSTYMKITGNQTTTGGWRFTGYNGGTVSSGTVTPDAYNGNYQYYINAGAHTLAAPVNDCAIDILVRNGVAPGAITFSGFRVGTTGDAYVTTYRTQITTTFTNGSSTITSTGHGFAIGDILYFGTTGTLPTGFAVNTPYYVTSILSANTYTVAASPGGTPITAGSAGSGTHTMSAPCQFIFSIRRINGLSTYTIKALQ